LLKAEDFAGCPADLVAAARQAAMERNLGAEDYVITLSRSLVEPFLTFADRRDLRERAWRSWTKRVRAKAVGCIYSLPWPHVVTGGLRACSAFHVDLLIQRFTQ
jgi:hypothetical protein